MSGEIINLALFAVFLASLPTGWRVLKYGNAVDPLGREILEENERKRAA